MSYREWRRWVGSLHWCLRWFVLLVLLRSLLDVMYFLKDISPLLSPLNLVGVATPLLVVASYFSRSFPHKDTTFPDVAFAGLGLVLTLNAASVLASGINLGSIETAIKFATPVFIYFFVRHLIRSRTDLHGLLTTFLYGSIFPVGMILWERLIGPLGNIVQTRGYQRFEGLYADVMSYAIYLVGALTICLYFYVQPRSALFRTGRSWKIAAVLAVALFGLTSMHHASSWGVGAALLTLFVLQGLSGRAVPAALVVVVLLASGFYLWGGEVTIRVAEMYQTEYRVLQGELDTNYMFHGRMSRWTRYIAEWQEIPAIGQVLGVSVVGPSNGAMLFGIHNDYLRILFAAGWLGLAFYLLFHGALLLGSFSLEPADRFLVRAVIAIMLLYSVTTVVTTYIPLMYLCLSVLGYASLLQEARVRRATFVVADRPGMDAGWGRGRGGFDPAPARWP